jgi:hypothetical protein
MMILAISGQANSGKDSVADVFTSNYGFKKLALADPFKEFCRVVFDWSRDQLWGPSQFRNDIDGRYHMFRPSVDAQSARHIECDSAWSAAKHNLFQCGRDWIHDILVTGHAYPKEVTTPEQIKEFEDFAFTELVDWFHRLGLHHASTLSPRVALQTLGSEWGRGRLGQDIWVNNILSRAKQAIVDSDYTGVIISDVRFENELAAVKAAGGKVILVERPGKLPDTVGGSHASETEQQGFDKSAFSFMIQNDGSLSDLYEDIKICAMCLGLTA